MNTKQEEIVKSIVTLQDSMKTLLNTVNDLFAMIKENREFIEKNGKLIFKTTRVLQDLADIAGSTMKVDAEDIKVSNKINGGIPKIKEKPKSMKDIGMVDLSTPEAQEDFLKKVKKLNSKYNES